MYRARKSEDRVNEEYKSCKKKTIHSKGKEPDKQRYSNNFGSAIDMEEEEVMLRNVMKVPLINLSISFSSDLLSCFFT